ncbi:MAG: ABC transporter permease [Eubacteriales bacterium]|nr:ABC transporter permease [Eubacteriales bacterium]
MKINEAARAGKLKINWSFAVPCIVLAMLIIAMGILKPATLSLYFLGIKCDISVSLVFVAAGQTLVLISEGIDLSVGGVMSIATCIMATMSEISLVGAILLCLVIGLAVGCINGLLISKLKMQPLITTLSTWTVLGGCALWILKTDGGYIPPAFTNFLIHRVGGIPVTLLFIIAVLIMWFFLKNTAFGYSVYAIGSNERAAYFNGIHITKTKIKIFCISGVCAALGGIMYAGINATGSPTVGESNIMMSIAAAVIGGTSLTGGRGGVTGTVVGVFILKLISDILVFAGITSYYTSLCQGLLLIICVAIGSVSTLLKNRRRLEYD